MAEKRTGVVDGVHSVGVAPTTALRQPTRVAGILKEALTHSPSAPANPYVPETLFHAIHAAASQLVEESGDERMFRSMRPSSLYALGVLAHEYALHVADLHIDALDKQVAEAFEEIDAAEDDWIRGGCTLPDEDSPVAHSLSAVQQEASSARTTLEQGSKALEDSGEDEAMESASDDG